MLSKKVTKKNYEKMRFLKFSNFLKKKIFWGFFGCLKNTTFLGFFSYFFKNIMVFDFI